MKIKVFSSCKSHICNHLNLWMYKNNINETSANIPSDSILKCSLILFGLLLFRLFFCFGDPGPMDVFSGYIVIVVGIVIGFSFNVFAISENTIVISITLLASNAVGVIIIEVTSIFRADNNLLSYFLSVIADSPIK